MKRGINVLVVDDDLDHNEYMYSFLAQEGYEVQVESQPTRAIEEIRKGRHQILILDLVMPEMSGIELLEEIRKEDNDLCVIVLTAYPSVDSAIDSLKYKAFHYVRKPFDIGEFRKILGDAIQEKGLTVDPTKTFQIEIGDRVRQLRKQKKLSLKQLANRSGLSASLISQVERGKSAPSIVSLHRIATALNEQLEHLFQGF